MLRLQKKGGGVLYLSFCFPGFSLSVLRFPWYLVIGFADAVDLKHRKGKAFSRGGFFLVVRFHSRLNGMVDLDHSLWYQSPFLRRKTKTSDDPDGREQKENKKKEERERGKKSNDFSLSTPSPLQQLHLTSVAVVLLCNCG